MKPGERGLRRLVSATRYSVKGLRCCWETEAAFRQELVACLVLVPAALLLGEGGLEKGLLVGSCFLVLIVELLNSGIEAVVDRIGEEHHVISGRAKDLASAAVFMSLLMFAAIWGLVLLY